MPNFWHLDITPILKIILFDYSWFLAKNLSNFVSLPWKLHNRYCHKLLEQHTGSQRLPDFLANICAKSVFCTLEWVLSNICQNACQKEKVFHECQHKFRNSCTFASTFFLPDFKILLDETTKNFTKCYKLIIYNQKKRKYRVAFMYFKKNFILLCCGPLFVFIPFRAIGRSYPEIS